MIRRLALVTAALLAVAALAVVGELYRPYQGYPGSRTVVIEPGMRAPEIADRLIEEGVLPHRVPFLFRYLATRKRASIKAGEYVFDRPLRPVDVYRKLVEGEVLLHAVLVPEGSDRFDIARILEERLGIDRQEFLRASGDTAPIRHLVPDAPSLEGYLFPDTYLFPRGASAQTAIAAMVGRFRRVLESRFPPEVRADPKRLHEVATLASLVEKETPAPDERRMVASVFLARLRKNRPLQCDPTVVYAARLEGRPIEAIKRSDLAFDHPYNTYRRAGLPPGPIANPGKASLEAALEAEPGEFLYFVSDNRGGHLFAKTLAEHERNVARYRRQLAQTRRASEVESAPGLRDDSKRRRRSRSETQKGSEKGGQSYKQEADHPRVLPGT
jgi:UPF0755 protein